MVIGKGKIVEGKYKNWNFSIEDDSLGETGGYYLLLYNDLNKGYDLWFEDILKLKNQLNSFRINWEE